MRENRKIDVEDYDALADAFSDFETVTPCHKFIVGDVWVWPIIRTYLSALSTRSNSTNAEQSNQVQRRGAHGLVKRVRGYGDIFNKALALCAESLLARDKNRRRIDVVGFTRVERHRLHEGYWVDTILEPVAMGLEKRSNLSVEFWGSQPNNFPLARPIRGIEHNLKNSLAAGKLSRKIKRVPSEPSWFSDVGTFAQDRLGVEFKWPEFLSAIEFIQDMRNGVARMLRRQKTSLILTDCWYDWWILAAILAARSEGIRVCEVQHGIQEYVHCCYHKWRAIAPSGYLNPFPDIAWVWGDTSARHYINHSLIKKLLVGGHHFLITGSEETEGKPCESNSTSIRIGFSLTYPLEPLIASLRKLISCCPLEWEWVLRLHPSDDKGHIVLAALKQELADHHIEVGGGQNSSVVNFFSQLDVHATHESTCALEALTLGLPTLVTLPRAVKNFQEWIKEGVLIDACDPLTFPDDVKRAMGINKEKIKGVANKIFATAAHYDKAIAELVNLSISDGASGEFS